MSARLNVSISTVELYLDPINQYGMESMGRGLNPGSVWSNLENVAIIKPAPVNSTSNMENSAMTSPWRSLARPADGPVRPPSFNDSLTLIEAVFRAAANPKTTPVRTQPKNDNLTATRST